jgi:hypothetical protein
VREGAEDIISQMNSTEEQKYQLILDTLRVDTRSKTAE